MGNRYTNPVPQAVDSAGLPRDGGSLAFYLTGSSTLADIYQNAALTTPATNPQELNELGQTTQEVFLDPAITYKVALLDADDVVVWTRDPVVDLAANVTAAFRVYAGDPNGNVAGSAGAVGGAGASVVYDITNQLLYICTTSGVAAAAVWTQQGNALAGQVTRTGVITPTTLAANTDNWSPTGLSTASVIRVAASAAYNLTGIEAQPTGSLLVLENIGTFNITLTNNATSTAVNRFQLPADTVLAPDSAIEFRYDGSSSRWRAMSMQAVPASDTLPGLIELAVQSEMETATDVVRAVTPGRLQYHPGAAKAWGVFNGSGVLAVGGSHNIASVTDNGTGNYSPQIATDMSSAAYAAVASACSLASSTSAGDVKVTDVTDLAAGSFRILISDNNTDTLADCAVVTFACFGDQ